MTRATSATIFNVTEVLERSLTGNPRQDRHFLFEHVTELDDYALDDVLIYSHKIPDSVSSRKIVQNIAALLDVHLKDLISVFEISESTLSRQSVPSKNMIDRAYSLIGIFTRVAQVLSPQGARHWMTTPNPALDGARPYALLSTRYGEQKVENLIQALLNGAVL